MQLYSSYTIDDPEKRAAFETWKSIKLEHNLWYQPESDLYFSIDCVRELMGKFNCVFTYTKEQFAREKGGTTEYTGKGLEVLQTLAGAKVLLIGGGPSTDQVEWNAGNYDLLVSCNNFYLNPRIVKEKIDVIYINSTHPYPRLQEFIRYVSTHKPLIITDSIAGVANKSRLLLQPKKFLEIELRFNGRIGILPRLIICLCLGGVASIDIVGMDGVSPKSNMRYHSFLRETVAGIGSTEEYYQDWSDVVLCYQRNYIMFFDYLFNDLKVTQKFKNLGEGCEDNILAGISKVLF